MAAYKQKIDSSAQLAVTFTTLYTCPLGATAEITALATMNETTTARTVTYSIKRSGGGDTEVVTAQSVPANNTVPGTKMTSHFEVIGEVLMPGDILQAKASAASALRPWGAVTVRS